MTSLAIVDNDFIEKSAAVDLLHELPNLLDVPLDGFRILPTAKWRYTEKRRAKAVSRLNEDKVNAILAFCERTPKVQEADIDDVSVLSSIPNIDEGEMILLSYASRDPHSIFATGDKRCLSALVTTPTASEIVARLKERVVCFEQLILRSVLVLGFEEVRARVVPWMACDTALRSAFGSGMQATWDNVQSTLKGQVTNLRATSGTLLSTL